MLSSIFNQFNQGTTEENLWQLFEQAKWFFEDSSGVISYILHF